MNYTSWITSLLACICWFTSLDNENLEYIVWPHSIFWFFGGIYSIHLLMCNVLPGDKSPTQESLKALIYGTDIYLSPMHASSEVAQKIFSSLRPYKLNIPEASRDRRLGTAIEVAPAIIQGPSAEMSRGVVKRAGDNNRIIVCTGGPNTYVPGLAPSLFCALSL